MLPKVATQILHTTSRAAAQVVQTPLRSVFQTGSSGSSNIGNRNGPSNSGWGGHGAGAGSTKQNTGSRYYSSFGTAGRAVSQANAVSASVDGSFAPDENDELVPLRTVVIGTQPKSQTKRPRIRSSSVSLTKTESPGVLKTLQLQGRSRFLHTTTEASAQPIPHQPIPLTSSRPRRNSTSSSDGLDRPSSPARNFSTAAIESGSVPTEEFTLRPRRNSTSSTDGFDKTSLESPQPITPITSSPVRPRRNSTSSIEGYDRSDASSVETKPTTPPLSPRPSRPSTPVYKFSYLLEAKETCDPHRVAEAIAKFRASAKEAQTQDFNHALDALYTTRQAESVLPMLETYNDMIKLSVQPDARTYSLLLMSLTQRDFELGTHIKNLSDLLQRVKLGLDEGDLSGFDRRIKTLRQEHKENFVSTLALFHTAKNLAPDLPLKVYLNIIYTCGFHASPDAALEVFHHVEKLAPNNIHPRFYQSLIQVYGNTNDSSSAEKFFQRYITAGREGALSLGSSTENQKYHIACWNTMIESYFRCGLPDKAIGLLDQMMDSPADLNFTMADIPHPASATYTTVLRGFCDAGDIQTAWIWYERLSEQGVETPNRFLPSNQPIKPDPFARLLMVEALAKHDRALDVNKVFLTIKDYYSDMRTLPLLVYGTNMRAMKEFDDVEAKRLLEFLTTDILPTVKKPKHQVMIGVEISLEYLRRGYFHDALVYYAQFFDKRVKFTNSHNLRSSMEFMTELQTSLHTFQDAYMGTVTQTPENLTFEAVVTLMQCGQFIGVEMPKKYQKHVLHAYAVAKDNGQVPLRDITIRDWEQLLMMAIDTEGVSSSPIADPTPTYAFTGVLSLVEDLARFEIDVEGLSSGLMRKTIRHLISLYGPNKVISIFESLGPAFQRALEESDDIRTLVIEGKVSNPPQNVVNDERTQRLTQPYGNLTVNATQTKVIEEALRHNNIRSDVLNAYARLKQGLEHRKVPAPRVLGRLIQGLGRQGDVDKVKEVYAIAQKVFGGLKMQKDALREGWICVEDSMIIALGHAGDIDNAHVHRMRLIEQNAPPSADAYGALILYVKDTTDDASNAMTLYREAEQSGVEMNIYLFNNIISKLAKARKADHALEMFHKMKAQGIKPSSITYGALIGACARVGDVQSAEALFAEMVEQKNFKPRVPPYNTMMQLYTMTKPNRERALWFYEQMGVAGVKPTSHTYKLLLDAYGSIEPVDLTSMEAVFEELKKDPHVEVQGTHYASLINAYGCVQRDLDKAIAMFDSVYSVPSLSPSAPSSRLASSLDAVVFEAMINVLVSHRRTDLIPEYINKMTAAGVHMTAYIANFLVKGYAIVGELDKAREIFESLLDPPTGIAAPNNHAPHDPSSGTNVACMEPVYREPSTWEVMVRAELGAGYRDRALDLLERLKARQYPEAVYNRISGVMVDHSSLT